MERLKIGRWVALTTVVVLGLALASDSSAQGRSAAAEPSTPRAGLLPSISRTELYSLYRWTERKLEYTGMTPMGVFPLKVESDLSETVAGVRVFTDQIPLPIVDLSYRWFGDATDLTVYTPGGVVLTDADDHDHELRAGAMMPVPNIGLVKAAAWDTEAVSAYGFYFVPQFIKPVVLKLGYEWSEVAGADDDEVGFIHATLPWRSWRFSLAGAARDEGPDVGGGSVGYDFGGIFAAGGVFGVEDDRPAYGAMLGRYAEEGKTGPTFWCFYVDNPTYHRINVLVALGKPGVPKESQYNDYANGQYTALFTDQIGEVVPIVVRNFEEMRVWKRPDEYAMPAEGSRGGVALSVDAIRAAVGWEIFQGGLFYTCERFGPLILPHVGPVVESERLPGVGRQPWRYGLEIGSYIGTRTPDAFYKAGRFYLGVSAKSDFDDYYQLMGEVRINL